MNLQTGQVLRATSGTRAISVTVARIAEDGAVTLRCNADWSFQAGDEFTLTADRFAGSVWQRAAEAA